MKRLQLNLSRFYCFRSSGALEDAEKVKDSKKVRRGAGKSRNRRYVQRRGPLVIYDVSEGLDKVI